MVTNYPRSTSWGAALGGWLAAIGLLAITLPFVQTFSFSISPAVPIVLCYLVTIGIAYLVGGYIAGRVSGVRTGFHGLLSGAVGLGIVLVLTLLSVTLNPLAVWMATAYPSDAVRMWVPDYGGYVPGVIAAFVIVLAAWLGGILAPSRVVSAIGETPAVTPTERRIVEERRERATYRPAPVAGAKGGEVHEETKRPPIV